MSRPEVSVVVASLRRPLRLRWLLNALAEQDSAPLDFEVIVAHDPGCTETVGLLKSHPLARDGRLRAVAYPHGRSFPGAGRNVAWPLARGEVVLFTDDDCRPRRDWVARALRASQARPGVILQGKTVSDPDESGVLLGAPWAQTVIVTPPTPWCETCNIAYPRAVLERLGGFAEDMRVGEDTELACRARAAGISLAGAPELVVFHAVHESSLIAVLRAAARWRDLALLVQRHPGVRRHLWGRVWWKREHAALVAAAAGMSVGRHNRIGAVVLAGPWLALSMGHRGLRPRGIARSLTELPGRAAIDLAELVTLVRGSLRYRTLIL